MAHVQQYSHRRRQYDNTATDSPSSSSNSTYGDDTLSYIPLRRYLSIESKTKIRTNDLPKNKDGKGVYTPAGIFVLCVRLTVPLAYIYILLVLLRELHLQVTFVRNFLVFYLPQIASVLSSMKNISPLVEIWAIIEAIFYIALVLHLRWLQYLDPLEASLKCAPMLEIAERRVLWDRIMDSEKEDVVSFLEGWFFDEGLDKITKYDVFDFVTWSMFDGRNQEHLTRDELMQLDEFVEELEWRIGAQLARGNTPIGEGTTSITPSFTGVIDDDTTEGSHAHPFRFLEHPTETPPGFFTNLFENYKHKYEQYRQILEKAQADFHPVQDLRDFMHHKKQQLHSAEETAMATATSIRDRAYFTFIDEGSPIDKQIAALSHATQTQLGEAWNQMCDMRHETAKFLSSQREQLVRQMKGYQLLLDRMRSMSSAVPSSQMADLMKKITQCNDAIERVESRAREAFGKATGFARMMGGGDLQQPQPKRYAKYSRDPLLGVMTYPLIFHLFFLSMTQGVLRLLMKMRGFERMSTGQISYYYHPGRGNTTEETPIVFVHGIGVGLIYYMNLMDSLLKLGRPIFLPEIPYVTSFHNWLSPNSILPPAAVASTLTAMLATHGYIRAAFMGHSYGTSWLSFMCKLAPAAMERVIFIDPICFKLHTPFLTKQFVYQQSDPGCTSYVVRTDVIINWTIQRGFPWARIAIFVEDIQVPCTVFLSERDALVPTNEVERYLIGKGGVVQGHKSADKKHYAENNISATILNGVGHGDWVDAPEMLEKIVLSADVSYVKKTIEHKIQ